MAKVYLDACALSRPFDDQRQQRVQIEAESVRLVLTSIQSGTDEWVGSGVLEDEVDQCPDPERSQQLRALLQFAGGDRSLSDAEIKRGEALERLGFKSSDALHIACAEAAGCDVLLTTDGRMLRTARRHKRELGIRVENPVDWVREVNRP